MEQVQNAPETVAALIEILVERTHPLADLPHIQRPVWGLFRSGGDRLPQQIQGLGAGPGHFGWRARRGGRRLHTFGRWLWCGRRRRDSPIALHRLDQVAAVGPAQAQQALPFHLLHELEKRSRAVVPLAECRIQLQQGALEQAKLRRHALVGQNLERALDVGQGF